MNKIIKIKEDTIRKIENIARVVFPMEIEAQLFLKELDKEIIVRDFHIPTYYGNLKLYEYSNNFCELINNLKKNNTHNFYLERFAAEYNQAKELFEDYKECQRRRHTKECNVEFKNMECAGCRYFDRQPSRPYMYDWFSLQPSIAWHSHVTSKYGDIENLCIPSDPDTHIIAKRIYMQGHLIKAEMITCTCEDGRQKTKLYYVPDDPKEIFKPKKRKEMDSGSVSII